MLDRIESRVGAQQQQIAQIRARSKALANSTALTTPGSQTPPSTTTPGTIASIDNLTRDGDHNHSIDTWWNTSPSATDQRYECAYVYTHEPDTAIEVFDGEISLGTPTRLDCVTSTPFDPGHVGVEIVVYGAGAAGADLVTTIASFVTASRVTLTLGASTAVLDARVRFRLQNLGRDNTRITPAGTVNDALKDPTHGDWGSNIQDPSWTKAIGVVNLGSTNTVDYPFGFFISPAGTVWTNQIPIYPGRTLRIIFNIARTRSAIKVRGHLFVGIWNNTVGARQFLEAAAFALVASVSDATPAVTTTAQYQVIARSDRGYTYVSNIYTLANSPDINSFIPEVVVNGLAWTGIPGILQYDIYRKLGAGNVELIYTLYNGQTSYQDNNPGLRFDTGSTDFPTVNGTQFPKAYVASPTGSLDDLAVDGVDPVWKSCEFFIPIGATTNLTNLQEAWLRLGVTEACDLEVEDAVVSILTDHVTSATAEFDAKVAGLPITIDDGVNPPFVGSVSSWVSATEIVLSTTPAFSAAAATLTITGGGIRGLKYDLVGTCLQTGGVWANHPEDLNGRGQNVASNPNGSTQGGIDPGGIDPGGSGGPTCPCSDELVGVMENYDIRIKPAGHVVDGEMIFSGNMIPNRVIRARRVRVDAIADIHVGDAKMKGSPSHRLATNLGDLDHGKAAYNAENSLLWANGTLRSGAVSLENLRAGNFEVVEFQLSPGHTYVVFDREKYQAGELLGIVSINVKPIRDEI